MESYELARDKLGPRETFTRVALRFRRRAHTAGSEIVGGTAPAAESAGRIVILSSVFQ